VVGEIEVLRDDEIELGTGGPRFAIDMQGGPIRVVLPTESPVSVAPVAATEPGIAKTQADDRLPMVQGDSPDAAPSGRNLPALRPPRPAPRYWPYALAGGLLLVMAIGLGAHRGGQSGVATRAPAVPVSGPASTQLPAPSTPPNVSSPPLATAATEPPHLAPAVPESADHPVAVDPPGPPALPSPVGTAARESATDAPARTEPLATEVPAKAASAEQVPSSPPPDLAGTVRKIAGASRFMVEGRWIELYGVDDPSTGGEHNLAVYRYLRPFAGEIECYQRADARFACFGGGQDLALVAIRNGFVRLTSDAPAEYRAAAADHALSRR
jgi:hypothetical protein